MSEGSDGSPVPSSVRTAAVLIALYGTIIVANAVINQAAVGWDQIEARGFPRAAGRFVFMCALAWGLVNRQRWAWWCSVLFGAFFALGGVTAMAFYWAMRDNVALPPSSVILIPIAVAALSGSVAFLLVPASRSAFRKPTA